MVIGRNPGSQRSSVKVARVGLRPVRDKRGKNNRRSINRGCKHRKQIRQSNNSHRKQNFFDFCEIWAVTIQHHQQGPEIQDDPGERGERKERRRSSTPLTRDSAPCRRRTSIEKLSAERRHRQKNETVSDKRKNDRENQIKG